MIYLDNAATTQITKPVLDAMMPYLTTEYGNPSSLYQTGRKAKMAIEHAREQIASAINAKPNEIFFTSGATESNNIVAKSFKYLVAHTYEHHSISHQPNRVEDWNLRLSAYHYDYVTSQMLVNNETGDIFEPLDTKNLKSEYHIDATQAFGHMPIDVRKLDCDYLSLSGHKIHAPKGIGVLYVKNGDTSLLIGQFGGQQEKGFRAGTENVAGIVAMGKACELYNFNPERDKRMKFLKSYLLDELAKVQSFHINAFDINNCAPNIISLAFEDVEAESILLMLDNEGICVSAGSACNSKSIEMSDVLQALHTPESLAFGTIRVSMSEFTSLQDIATLVQTLNKVINRLRR